MIRENDSRWARYDYRRNAALWTMRDLFRFWRLFPDVHPGTREARCGRLALLFLIETPTCLRCLC